MTPAEREFALKELDGSRERLLGTVRGLSREQLEYRAARERWSVAECLEHIIVVERLMFQALEGRMQQAPDLSKHGDWEGQDEALTKQMIVGRKKRKLSPEVFRPTGRWPTKKLLPEFEAVRSRTREFSATFSSDLRSCFLVHPVLGRLDGYQWLLIVARHCERHRLQVEEVIASSGFPPAEQKESVLTAASFA
jgi:uncharacterized damage-inducible protein DinB